MRGRLLHWWCCRDLASYDGVVPFVGLCLCFMLCFPCTFVYDVTHTHTQFLQSVKQGLTGSSTALQEVFWKGPISSDFSYLDIE
jgi:hypothetical protein